MKDDGHLRAWPRTGIGLAAGLAGTVITHPVLKASERWLPSTQAPSRGDPAHFAVRQVEKRLPAAVREQIPDRAREVGAKAAPLLYGATAGALYALLRPRGGPLIREGFALGVAVWAAGYLGWLPRSDLMAPVSEHTLPQVLAEIGQHAVYGIATAAAFTAAARLLE